MPGDWHVRFLGGPDTARCPAYPPKPVTISARPTPHGAAGFGTQPATARRACYLTARSDPAGARLLAAPLAMPGFAPRLGQRTETRRSSPRRDRRMVRDARKTIKPLEVATGLNPADFNANWQNFRQRCRRPLSTLLQVFSGTTRGVRYRFTRERPVVRAHPCP